MKTNLFFHFLLLLVVPFPSPYSDFRFEKWLQLLIIHDICECKNASNPKDSIVRVRALKLERPRFKSYPSNLLVTLFVAHYFYEPELLPPENGANKSI